MTRLICFIILSFNFILAPFANAIEKESLQAFFKEYDASKEKSCSGWGWDRLSYAIEKGHIEIAEFLVLRGDPIDQYQEPWESHSELVQFGFYRKHPLVTAIRHNYINLAILLVQMSKDISKTEELKQVLIKRWGEEIVDKKHALQIAIEESSNYDIIRAMILAGVDVNMKYRVNNLTNFPNTYYFHPLNAAIESKKLDIARLLLEHNANLDGLGDGITTLYLAVECDYIEGVILLLEYGADPLYSMPGHYSPLELAMDLEHWDIVDLLLGAAIKTVASPDR